MAKRRREKIVYHYECTISGEKYTLDKKLDNTEDLVSVQSYYELNPDQDDRPADIKKQLGLPVSEE